MTGRESASYHKKSHPCEFHFLKYHQLFTCHENRKRYWAAKNAATFRQRSLRECRIREWFCLKELDNPEKAKPPVTDKGNKNETLSKKLFINQIEKISHKSNIANCWICEGTQMSEVWSWGETSLAPFDWEYTFDTQTTFWKAPEHLFWICKEKAYTPLPGDGASDYTVEIIKPAFFFLLPQESKNHLEVPLYSNLRKSNRKKKIIINISSIKTWKREIWTPEK